MKRPALDSADLALDRAKQLDAAQLSGGGEDLQVPPTTLEKAFPTPKCVTGEGDPYEATTATKSQKRPAIKGLANVPKGEKRWKTSVQLSKQHERIVNEVMMHYRMEGLRPVSVNTIILAALEMLKRTPELDKAVHAIVAADKRIHRLI